MAVKIGDALVSFGSYTDKNGERHAKNRKIGEVMMHSDGRIYIIADRAFNPGALPAKEGSDSYFIALRLTGVNVTAKDRQPGYEG
jgi:hypothetical protein